VVAVPRSVSETGRRRWLAWCVAVACPSAVSLLVWALEGGAHLLPLFPFFTLAVIVSALLGGLLPGLLAVGLSLLCIAAVFGPHFIELVGQQTAWLSFIAFGLSGASISLLLATLRGKQDEIRQSDARFRALVTASSDVVYRMSPDWGEMRELRRQNDLADTEAPMRTWLEKHIPLDDQSRVLAAIKEAIRTKSIYELEHRVIRVDGTSGWIVSRAIPLLDANGKIAEWFGVTTDITDRKRAEEALIRSEKLAAAGRLAATIAHEVNNPLEAASNGLFLISSDTALKPETKKYVTLVDQEVRRAAHMTQQTLGFHREHGSREPVDLPKLIEEVLILYARKIQNRRITVRNRYNHGRSGERCEGPLLANAGELRQVTANLLANGIDALSDGGRLEIRVSRRSYLNSGDPRIQLTIADNGYGIRTENLKRIFEPFFTTKVAYGTGLGLWVVQELVRRNNGSIKVRSRKGKGTVFCMSFPAMRQSSENEVESQDGSRQTSTALDGEPAVGL
jgi:signal transduction histidine kinase